MAIQINRGPLGDRALFISFVGTDSTNSSSTKDIHILSNIVPVASGDDVLVYNQVKTLTAGYTVYEVGPTHYSEWLDEFSNTFASAADVVSHIEDIKTTAENNIQRLFYPITDSYNERFSINTQIDYTFEVDGAISYYWKQDTVPTGLTVSIFDGRVLTGIVTQTGSWDVICNVRNRAGISSVTLQMDFI